jgi:hypothetical protein
MKLNLNPKIDDDETHKYESVGNIENDDVDENDRKGDYEYK